MRRSVKFLIIFVAALIIITAVSFIFNETVAGFFINRAAASYRAHNVERTEFYVKIANFFNSKDPRILAYFCRIGLKKNPLTHVSYCDKAATPELKDKDPDLYVDTLYNVGASFKYLADSDLRAGKDSLDNYLSAEAAYKKYIEESGDANKPQTLYRLAELYFFFLNKPEDALKTLKQWVSQEKFIQGDIPFEKSEVYNLLGRTYSYFHRYQDAEKMFREAIALKDVVPENSIFNVHFHLNLARVLIEEGKIKEGFDELNLTKKLNPTYPPCSEARYYYLAKDFKKAIELANTSTNKNIPTCWYVFAFSYYELGQKDKAKEPLTKYIDFLDHYTERYREAPLDIDYDIPAKSISRLQDEGDAKRLLEELNK